MKTEIPAIILSVFCVLVTASYGESPYERDLKQLIEQRDKAIAAASVPIVARFNASAEQLLRHAIQAGDLDAANKIKAAMTNEATTNVTGSVKELRKQLVRTTWKAVPSTPLRGGLAERLTFTEKSVEPGGYEYDVESHRSVTIIFKGGDKQVMMLTKGGKRLQFTHGKSDYAYELVSQ